MPSSAGMLQIGVDTYGGGFLIEVALTSVIFGHFQDALKSKSKHF
jgi:hypothetical protein